MTGLDVLKSIEGHAELLDQLPDANAGNRWAYLRYRSIPKLFPPRYVAMQVCADTGSLDRGAARRTCVSLLEPSQSFGQLLFLVAHPHHPTWRARM